MGRIARLPSELVDQIAAGEVVERPASAAKELIENALDAKARRIAVTVEFGGKRLIRVEDDGEGMTAEDAALSLQRHATSKLARLEDLAAIGTLGFRGEALPAIASVSRLTLRTRARGLPAGTEVRVNGGTISSVRERGMPEGTGVEVADLFYNVPARRKFLKSDAAEAAQITRVVTQLALGYPDVGFTLVSSSRQVVQCPPVGSLRERFFQLCGERPDLIEVGRDAAGVRVRGYIAAPGEHGPARGPQTIFVNRRVIRDRTIAHAIVEAYSAVTIKERSPEVYLFIELPADRVDVNVHPMKAEVRFLEPSLLHELLRRALGEALGQGRAPALQFRVETAAPPARPAPAIPGLVGGGGAAAAPDAWTSLAGVFGRPGPPGGGPIDLPPGPAAAFGPAAGLDGIRRLVPLGQFRDTYIIAVDQDGDGLAIVDQHVAHERVLFEQVMERLTSGRLEGQRLLEPMIVDMSAGQRQALTAHTEQLGQLGFEIEEFGGDAVRVAAVPALLDRRESEAAVRALANDLEGLDRGARVEEALRRMAATTACHGAVKANDRLTLEKMTYILDELRRTAYSTVCPHGRPVVLQISRREIERNFQRI